MTAAGMLATARTYLGTVGRPNTLTRRYAARHGAAFLDAPWCDISVSEWAIESGNEAAVLPRGPRAFTVWHAEDGLALSLWHPGTSAHIQRCALPGAIVFFDWDGTDTIGRIDHVGIVERNLGDGRVQTIEANTGDACKRRVRGPSVIAGFWNPPYTARTWTEELVKNLPTLKLGDNNFDVKTLRCCLFARGVVREEAYGGPAGLKVWLERTDFNELDGLVRGFQRAEGLDDDGEVGPVTWAALLRRR